MQMSVINWLAVLVAGLSAFILGGVWYSPALFGNAWMKENKLTAEEIKKGNKGKIFGWAFVLALVMSANLAMFLADAKTDIVWGTTAGLLAGVWVFAGIAITGLFEHKTARYIFINGFYQMIALALMGAIIGLWR
ncbi:MAG: DUF1761 domain-containing protein [Chitinophagaceae bacterium]